MKSDKIIASCDEAVADICDGASVMVGGFTGRGTPSNLLLALKRKAPKDLIIIRNDASGGWKNPIDIDILLEDNLVKKVITCFAVFGSPKKVSALEKKVNEGVTELELVPQGTLAERIRAGGSGVGAFYTAVGAGTVAADGKDIRVIGGKEMILEYALKADFSLIKAMRSDHLGNLVYNKSTRNFNPIMATAASTTIVEAQEIVEVGDIDPDNVMTPSIFVHRIVHVPKENR